MVVEPFPILAFVPPWWARPLIPAPLFLYSALVRFIIWYLDRRLKEEGQRIRYRRTLLAAPIDRLRLTSMIFKNYKMDLDFSHNSTPVGVLRASSDTLHDHSDAGTPTFYPIFPMNYTRITRLDLES